MLNDIIKGIKTYGRKIEFLRLLHLLEGSHDHEILDELSIYQNEDGGFGHGLEPDNQDPNSSPLQTSQAMLILREITCNQKHPLLLKMYDYLLGSFDVKHQRWPLYMETVKDYPHAPWWDYKDIDLGMNPTASILGFILKYAPKDHEIYHLAEYLKQKIFQSIMDQTSAFEMHDLKTIIDLINDLESIEDSNTFSMVKEKVLEMMDQTIEKDASKWYTSYCATPTFLIQSKESFGSETYEILIKEELKLAKTMRKKDGLWEPTFSWNHKEVDQIWKAIIAINYLKLYMSYDI